jgi:threonine dehydratase
MEKTLDISPRGIEEAARHIDPVFLNTPQFVDDALGRALGRRVLVKVETANPVRSFKGRGAESLMRRFEAGARLVCASSGNFGQALAYAARRRGVTVHVFAPADVNPVKRARMESFGARVVPIGRDSAESEAEAARFAAETPGCVLVQDGREPLVAEGAGTIGLELLQAGPIDTVVVPVGDGALIAGIAAWVKERSPATRVVGVCAKGAPAMVESWKAGRPVPTDRSETIAEGIEVRSPVPESVVRLCALVDDMVMVEDADLLDAMALAVRTLGLLIEPSGAAGLAAIRVHDLPGERLATVLTGSNLRPEHLKALAGGDAPSGPSVA